MDTCVADSVELYFRYMKKVVKINLYVLIAIIILAIWGVYSGIKFVSFYKVLEEKSDYDWCRNYVDKLQANRDVAWWELQEAQEKLLAGEISQEEQEEKEIRYYGITANWNHRRNSCLSPLEKCEKACDHLLLEDISRLDNCLTECRKI